MAGHAATHQRIADASATDGSQNLSGINYGTRRNEDAGAMSSTLPISLNITGTSTMGGAQGFSGINYGTLNYGDTGARQVNIEEQVKACRNAFHVTNVYVDREKLISKKGKRTDGTCQWIKENKTFESWAYGDERLLWILGGPGKGKTMLSIFLTEELETITSNMENTELIFYFCVHDDDDRNSATKILRGLVYQILEKQPDLTKHALQYLETAEKTQQTMSSPEALWIIFRKIVLDVNFCKTFCVIDGLDECDAYTKKMLVPKIVDLFKHPTLAEIAFKLVIVSRDIPGLKGCTTVKLDPDNDNMVGRDVEQFIFDSVKDLSRIERADEAFLADVRNTLLERSSGSFLWVGFVMLELSEQTTRNEVQHTLRTIPQDLSSIYKRIVGQIKETHRPTSSLILGWVTTAARPLTLQELGAAIGIRRSASIAVEEVIRDHVTHCGPLLTVRKQEVTLVHESAKEYLLRNNSDSDATQGEIRINERGAHLKALQACLDCIEHSLLDAAPLVYDDDFFSKQAPLLKYAVLHWPEHAKRSSELAKNVFSKSKAFFRKKSDLRDQWQRIYWIFGLSINNPAKMPLLHLASYFGIVTWVELLVDKKAFLSRFRNLTHKKDSDGRTALMYAAVQGHEPVVRLLLLEGHADADAKNNDGLTALMQAAVQGHEPVARLLLLKGRADADAKDNDGWTALMYAAVQGHEPVARLLLLEGHADADAKNNNGWTALMHAAVQGHEPVARLLLLEGRADADAKDNNGWTALMYAAIQGHEPVARLLLLEGHADADAKDNDGRTALMYAAVQGHEPVARLLLLEGHADADAKDKDGPTALMHAAVQGHEPVARLLDSNALPQAHLS